MAAQAVQQLLNAVNHHEQVDIELLDYIYSILADPDPESCLEVLQELLAGAVPAFCTKSDEEQTALLLKLLDDVKACDARQHEVSSPNRSNLDALVAVFKQATIHLQQQAACADVTNTRASDTSKPSTSTGCNPSNPEPGAASLHDLSPLLALTPKGVSQHFLQHLLQHTFQGNMQQAADWLLECPDVWQQQEAWEEQQQDQEEQRQRQEQMQKQVKKQIVERFDLQVVPSGPLKPEHGVDILPGANKREPPQGKVRYRDGKVVSCKGEKYIVEKLGEEWDGGSKGKVYTKGKRGVGYR